MSPNKKLPCLMSMQYHHLPGYSSTVGSNVYLGHLTKIKHAACWGNKNGTANLGRNVIVAPELCVSVWVPPMHRPPLLPSSVITRHTIPNPCTVAGEHVFAVSWLN